MDLPAALPPLPPELMGVEATLLQRAFTHRSLRARKLPHEATNERLEFLGDAVLELVVSTYLFEEYPHWDEGRLTRYRAALVKTETLAIAAENLHLGEHLQFTSADEDHNQPLQPSLLADVFEAVIGALYVHQGYAACQIFIEKYLLPYQDQVAIHDAKDPKSLLQEKLQADGKNPPEYVVASEEGPDHAKIFTVEAQLDRLASVKGRGNSKQRAEQSAAEAALEKYFS